LWRLAEAARGERLWPVHRLDRETSGLVLFARTAQVHRTLSLAFESRNVEKRYLAQVAPPPSATEGALESTLVAARRGFMREARPGEHGVLAQTGYRVLKTAADRALVELRPITGRTHQLRLQLAALGSPIVGEPHYRRLEPLTVALPASRLWLHAARVALAHPLDGSPLVIEAEAPEGLWPPRL
jgi:23S rRNA-/tRNA-specific pseudouridylate synthase